MAIEIRPFRESDEPAVTALWAEALPDRSPHNDPALTIRNKLEVDRELFLVAVGDDGTAVGTAMGGYDGHRGWVYSVAVDARHRRRGIATALVRQFEALLSARGCRKVNLQVRAENGGVVSFYERLGYAVEERISMGKRL